MAKRKLDAEYTYRGRVYGPGDSVDVPDDFPEDVGERPKGGRKSKSEDQSEDKPEE